ncbi:MAG TPA: hypothetical protein ENK09_11050 [Nitrospirae bacterium]|nr:hypothetical protein [Nitrospirota bacterium]
MKNTNLSKRLVLRTFLIVILVQVVLFIMYKNREHSLVDRYLQEVTSTTEHLLTNSRGENLKALIEDISTLPYIYSINVYDNEDRLVITSYKGAEKTGSDLIVKELQLDPGNTGYKRVVVSFSRASLLQEMGITSSGPILLNILVFIVFLSLLYLLFRKEVDQRLHAFLGLVDKVSIGNLKVRIQADDTTEFGWIQRRLKLLIDNLSGIVRKLKVIIKNVSAAINQLKLNSRDVIAKMQSQQETFKRFASTIEEVSVKQKGITKDTEALMSLSDKNLSGAIEVKQTSEEIFRTMDELNTQLADVLSSVNELSKAAKEISNLSDNSNKRIQSVASSAEEIIKSTQEIESSAADSLRMSEETTRIIIEKGIFSTADAVEEMEHIEESIKGLMDTIRTFEDRSKDIEKILSVIKDITEQTGLLSLNAQILAVQAGEYGKSFSVVADEMKVLSEKTSSSTKEISRIISTLKHEMSDVVAETKKVVTMIGNGHEKVVRTAEALNEIYESSKKATDMSNQIVRATKEQTKGIESITYAIEHIKHMTQEIKRATYEQDKGVSYILNNIENIKNITEIVTRTAREQIENNNYIVQNIESANNIISHISSASRVQQDVNRQLYQVLTDLKNSNTDIIRDIREQTVLLSSLFEEVEQLQKELNLFQTEERDR